MKELFRWLVLGAGFINAALFVPQLRMLLHKKNSETLSLVTFGGFLILQLIMIIHGLLESNYYLAAGTCASALTCGSVVVLAVYYRILKRGREL
jgi:MtN3 and saliva related transmembrane protein